MVDFKLLVKAGVHFGHKTSRWCPKMAPYIWGHKNKVHLIDVSKTAHQIQKASKFLEGVAAEGKTILWVGTKKSAQNVIRQAAHQLKMPYVTHRWIGGTLSNNTQVKKSVTKLLHYEDIVAKSDRFPHYTKKELNTYSKMVDRLKKNVGGILNLAWPVGAVVLVDVRKENSALKEAVRMGVPVVALVDTNSDPSFVDYVIPANDDAPRSIRVVIDYLVGAVQKGKDLVATKKEEAKKEREKKIAAQAEAKKAAATAKASPTKAAPKKEVKVVAKKVEKVASKPKVALEAKKETKAPAAKKPAAKVEAKPVAKVDAKPAVKKEADKPKVAAEKKTAAKKESSKK